MKVGYFQASPVGISKLFFVVLTLLALSACGAVSTPAVTQKPLTQNMKRIDLDCITLVHAQQASMQNIKELRQNTSSAQYMSLAQNAHSCIDGIQFTKQHPDVKTAMQFNALAVVNYIKAGDMSLAVASLNQFKLNFPRQDLLFDDFTSFVDTATLLTKSESISQKHLAMLNINPQLRSEIERQRKWSLR